ncbi:hypothetical protein JCM6882_001753 [Rhodosporidiobolus microsporus]
MSSPPASPASTARPSATADRTPASTSERENFLDLALARLSLSRVASPAPPSSHATVPGAFPAAGGSNHSGSHAATFETLGTRTSRPTCAAEQEGEEGEGLRQPGSTFFTHSGSRTSDFTSGLMTPEEAQSYAGEVARDFLFSEEDEEGGGRLGSEKLIFYQSLVVQFHLCAPKDVPTSITACCKLLSGVHISIREYLNAVKKGKNVKNTVKQHRSRKELRNYLLEGPKKQKLVSLDTAKSELLQPFLVEVNFPRGR